MESHCVSLTKVISAGISARQFVHQLLVTDSSGWRLSLCSAGFYKAAKQSSCSDLFAQLYQKGAIPSRALGLLLENVWLQQGNVVKLWYKDFPD